MGVVRGAAESSSSSMTSRWILGLPATPAACTLLCPHTATLGCPLLRLAVLGGPLLAGPLASQDGSALGISSLLGRVLVGVEHRVRNRFRQPERQPAPPRGGRERQGRSGRSAVGGRRRGGAGAAAGGGGGGAVARAGKAVLVYEGEGDGLDQAPRTANQDLRAAAGITPSAAGGGGGGGGPGIGRGPARS